MAEFKLASGETVQVDSAVIGLLSNYTWRLDHRGYAMRKTDVDGKPGRSVLMHRALMGAKKGQFVDHADGDQLNNMLSNLRFATLSENGGNRRKSTGTASQFKGVIRAPSGKWRAQISQANKSRYLGTFDCEHAAGHAYNRAAIELFGEFAALNPVGFGKDGDHE